MSYNPTDDMDEEPTSNLAQPMSIQDMKDKEAREGEQRALKENDANQDRPIMENGATYKEQSAPLCGGCCIVM